MKKTMICVWKLPEKRWSSWSPRHWWSPSLIWFLDEWMNVRKDDDDGRLKTSSMDVSPWKLGVGSFDDSFLPSFLPSFPSFPPLPSFLPSFLPSCSFPGFPPGEWVSEWLSEWVSEWVSESVVVWAVVVGARHVCVWKGGWCTNLENPGWTSVSRGAKSTPRLTVPDFTFKSYAKDLSLKIFELAFELDWAAIVCNSGACPCYDLGPVRELAYSYSL